MSIVFDFDDIARRVGRKPDAEALNVNVQQHDQDAAKLAPSAVAAIRTLKSLGYTYCPGAEMWKPPLSEYMAPRRTGATGGLGCQVFIGDGGGGAGLGGAISAAQVEAQQRLQDAIEYQRQYQQQEKIKSMYGLF